MKTYEDFNSISQTKNDELRKEKQEQEETTTILAQLIIELFITQNNE